jgi:hypothetical protein
MKSARSRYQGHRFPPEVIGHAVWVYHRFCLSFRDVEDLLAERGINCFLRNKMSGKAATPGNETFGVVVRSNEDLCCMKREKAAENGNGA